MWLKSEPQATVVMVMGARGDVGVTESSRAPRVGVVTGHASWLLSGVLPLFLVTRRLLPPWRVILRPLLEEFLGWTHLETEWGHGVSIALPYHSCICPSHHSVHPFIHRAPGSGWNRVRGGGIGLEAVLVGVLKTLLITRQKLAYKQKLAIEGS